MQLNFYNGKLSKCLPNLIIHLITFKWNTCLFFFNPKHFLRKFYLPVPSNAAKMIYLRIIKANSKATPASWISSTSTLLDTSFKSI